jgi:regulator of sigma E protease
MIENILNILPSILVFLIIFSLLILVHEFGHFYIARKAGVKVEEFGLGLPPRAWGKKTKRKVRFKDKEGKTQEDVEEMIWSINWIPFGGFVRMLGEDELSKEAKNDPRSFPNRPIGWRIFVVVAGVLMNFLLGWIALSIALFMGLRPAPFLALESNIEDGKINNPVYSEEVTTLDFPENYSIVDLASGGEFILWNYVDQGIVKIADYAGVEIAEVLENSPAEQAGIQQGDFVVSINGKSVKTNTELANLISDNEQVTLEINRLTDSGEVQQRTIELSVGEDKKIGVAMSEFPFSAVTQVNEVAVREWNNPFFAIKQGAILSKTTVVKFFEVIGKIATTFKTPDDVAGPVGIARATHGFVHIGDLAWIFFFTAMLSFSLAIINILPFPALDGGRLIFLLFELFTGKKPNAKAEAIIHTVGFVLLLLLIFLITINDIVNIFPD